MGIIIAGIIIALVGYLFQLVNVAGANIVDLFDDFSGLLLRHAIASAIIYTGIAVFLIGLFLEIL